MTSTQGGYIDSRLKAIEQEFTDRAPHELTNLLFGYLNNNATEPAGEREIPNIPVRPGWTMDIIDSDVFGSKAQVNPYKDPVQTPITLAFWPLEVNDVSSNRHYYDGSKVQLHVGPEGVLDGYAGKWLTPQETSALLNDIKALLEPPSPDQ